MNVLILGAGAREHALALAAAKSPRLGRMFVAPGNPGCAAVAAIAAIDIRDHAAVVGFCRDIGVPTGDYRRFRDRGAALDYVRHKGAPIVVKADGLAAGKGVVVAMTLAQAEDALNALFDGAFGEAGAEVVVEEFLRGEEISFFAVSDGVRATPFGSARDHKRVGDSDTGPNTGGMGAYSPPSLMTPSLSEQVMREIVAPTVAGMRARGTPFRGVLFAGLIIGDDGPKLIEFNVRFGDPEAEVILTRLQDDLLEFLWGAAIGALPERAPEFSEDTALAVVMAARGYPGPAPKGSRIGGLQEAADSPGVSILHAATRRDGDAILADGGRVLAVTAIGHDLAEARARAYTAVDLVNWPAGFCRRDIGSQTLRGSNFK